MVDCSDCEEFHEGGFDCSKIKCVLCHDIHSIKELKMGICPKLYDLALKEKRKQSFPCLFCKDWEKEKKDKKDKKQNSPCIYCDDQRFIDRFVYCCLKGCERCEWQGLLQNPEWIPLKKKSKKLLKANEEECNCPICHESIVRKEPIYRLECEHIFHKDCSIRWLKINKVCPVCRKEDYHFPFEDLKIKPKLEINNEEESSLVRPSRLNITVPPIDRVLRSSRRRERSVSPVLNINASSSLPRYVSPLSRMNNPLWTSAARNRSGSPDIALTAANINRDSSVRPSIISPKNSIPPSVRANSRSRSRSDQRRTRPIREQSQQEFSSYSEDAMTGREKQMLAIRRARYFEENMEIAFGHLDENKIKQLAVNPNPVERSQASDPTELRWRNYAIKGKNLHRVPVIPPIDSLGTARKSVRMTVISPATNSQEEEVSESSSEESSNISEYNPSADH